MEFGAKIKLADGVRPEWLSDEVKVRWYSHHMGDDWWYGGGKGHEPTARVLGWDSEITHIRLPADHPHYQQNTPTPDERAVAPELVERMVSLLKRQVERLRDRDGVTDDVLEARAIVAALEPVDGDLVIAREIAADHCGGNPYMAEGDCDDDKLVKVAKAALARGRQLEKEGK